MGVWIALWAGVSPSMAGEQLSGTLPSELAQKEYSPQGAPQAQLAERKRKSVEMFLSAQDRNSSRVKKDRKKLDRRLKEFRQSREKAKHDFKDLPDGKVGN